MRTGGTARADVMFDASWWHRFCGIAFDEHYVRTEPFYRVNLEGRMRRELYERFGAVGLGSSSSEPVPVISTQMTPLNYLVGEVLGCSTYFAAESTPCTIPLKLSSDELDRLEKPNVLSTPIMRKLADDMDWLEREYGRAIGDINPQGVLNNAMCVADAEVFVLFKTDPDLARRILRVVTDTMIEVITFIRQRTGTSSISVTNIVEQVDPGLFVTSNCSTTMISPRTYSDYLLECDRRLARALPPFGVHHCGNDLEKIAPEYRRIEGLSFLEVGWGSDLKAVRALMPDTHLNARYSPVKMRSASRDDIERDVAALIDAGRPLEKLSISILGLDDHVPDGNVVAFFRSADKHWN